MDLRRDLRVAFGEDCEVAVDTVPRNGPAARTESAISLCPVGNDRGTWWFFNIKTKATFRADKWTVMATSAPVIEAMSSLYNKDEPKKRRLTRSDDAHNDAVQEHTPPVQVDAAEAADTIAVPTMRDSPTALLEDDGFVETIEDTPNKGKIMLIKFRILSSCRTSAVTRWTPMPDQRPLIPTGMELKIRQTSLRSSAPG